MKLEYPTEKFIEQIFQEYTTEEGNNLNENLLKLFETFPDEENEYHVLIKVAALNKIYSTSITNIKPVVSHINIIASTNPKPTKLDQYISSVDKISIVEWKNKTGKKFRRNNLSFSSKYIHFLSGYKTPIYDSYIWILIKAYLGQKHNNRFTIGKPKSFEDFYSTYQEFVKMYELEKISTYKLDKFLWQYGKKLIEIIEKESNLSLSQSKSELGRRLKNYS